MQVQPPPPLPPPPPGVVWPESQGCCLGKLLLIVHCRIHVLTKSCACAVVAEGTGEASKAEARSTAARTLLSGDFLNEIVALHREVFMSFQAQSTAPSSEDAEAPHMPGFWQAAWDRSYKLGGTILSQSLSLGQPLASAVDDAAAGGHLMALAKEQQKLTAKPLLEVGTQVVRRNPSRCLLSFYPKGYAFPRLSCVSRCCRRRRRGRRRKARRCSPRRRC